MVLPRASGDATRPGPASPPAAAAPNPLVEALQSGLDFHRRRRTAVKNAPGAMTMSICGEEGRQVRDSSDRRRSSWEFRRRARPTRRASATRSSVASSIRMRPELKTSRGTSPASSASSESRRNKTVRRPACGSTRITAIRLAHAGPLHQRGLDALSRQRRRDPDARLVVSDGADIPGAPAEPGTRHHRRRHLAAGQDRRNPESSALPSGSGQVRDDSRGNRRSTPPTPTTSNEFGRVAAGRWHAAVSWSVDFRLFFAYSSPEFRHNFGGTATCSH